MSNPSDRWRPSWLLAVAVLAIIVAVVVGYCASDAPGSTSGPANALSTVAAG